MKCVQLWWAVKVTEVQEFAPEWSYCHYVATLELEVSLKTHEVRKGGSKV